jgi:hypothetical protein
MKTMIPKRTIDEIVTLYSFEPQLRDVYVEGTFDRDVIEEVLSFGRNQSCVYFVDGIEVPDAILVELGFTTGNRQKVNALGLILKDAGKGENALCIIDRDLEDFLPTMKRAENVVLTDHVDMEGYFYSEDAIQRLLKVFASCKINNWDIAFRSLIETLNYLFLMRVCLSKYEMKGGWVGFDGDVTVDPGGKISLDANRFLIRLLNKNNLMKKKAEIEDALTALVAQHGACQFTRGHDLFALLAVFARKTRGIAAASTIESLERAAVLLVRSLQLERQPLFQRTLSHVR